MWGGRGGKIERNRNKIDTIHNEMQSTSKLTVGKSGIVAEDNN
jgi:hypothetical protein